MTRIVSGMRPTGALHLGHYFGVLQQWLELQREAECFYFAADWHALTTEYESPRDIARNTVDMVQDWLAAGVDPQRAVVFRQSDVKAHAELHLLLSMVVPVSWLERVPSYKDIQQNLQHKNLATYGFLGYPLLQTADIVIYRADVVPVGEDQLAHLELSREIVRRFHHLYGVQLFPEPAPRLTRAPKVPGTDGRKMSKSYGNAISLRDDSATVAQKTAVMVTDPQRVRRSDPGRPEVCDVFAMHQVASHGDLVAQIDRECRTAAIGCVQCKRHLATALNEHLDPMRERRATITPAVCGEVLAAGAARACREAEGTLHTVRETLGL